MEKIAFGFVIGLLSGMLPDPLLGAPQPPNIVLIYADDIGFGDLGSYGATRVQTPSLDRMAKQGLRFTDAHSSAATCTPSRYSLLTGNYSFRERRARVLPGDAPALISPGTSTVASILREKGYRTGVVGKWHLGLGMEGMDWNGEIRPGPLEIGFDYAFLVPATGDRVPCVYVENHRVVGLDPSDPIQVSFKAPLGELPTGQKHPELLRLRPSHGHDQTIVNGISRIGYMSGGRSALWVDEDMADTLTSKATSFIRENATNPFFLYFAFHDIHVPRVPHPRFVGKSLMGPRGDAIAQLDWCVGEVMKTLEELNLSQKTLVVFTSDNGPVVDDGYRDEAVQKLGDHRPSGPFRGGKYSNFEGGTRVPMIVRWPQRVAPGISDALICQVDFAATFAALTNHQIPHDAALDSINLLPALLGESNRGRETLVEQAGTLSLRQGAWKLIPASAGAKYSQETDIELGNDPAPQLFDLASDPGETTDLSTKRPEQLETLLGLLEQVRSSKRTRN